MKKVLLIAAALATTVATAQEPDVMTGESRTGSRLLPRIRVVLFDTSPILLSAGVAAAVGATIPIQEPAGDRPSITFILNKRLINAERIFRQHPGFTTDHVVTHLDSLLQVREYLSESEQGPYGIVNLVAHSSPQTGLAVPIHEGGPRASSRNLAALNTESSGRSNNIDQHSLFRVYGCGVAADPALQDGLARFFAGNPQQTPQVAALREFIEFSDQDGLNVLLRDGLTVVAPGRMAARRQIERIAARQSLSLPFRWQWALKTKPLEIVLQTDPTDLPPEQAAGQSKLVTDELIRLGANLDDFKWQYQGSTLQGEAVLGYMWLEPPEQKRVLAHPGDANWIARR